MDSKINIRKALLMVTMLFPLTTIVERYLGFLNKALLILALFLLFVETFKNGKAQKAGLIFACFSLATYVLSLAITPISAIKLNPNMAVYYIFLILYYLFFANNLCLIEKDLLYLQNYIFFIVIFFTAFLSITIFLPGSHITITAGGWGNEHYFASFSNSPNRVGPACLFIVVLMIYLLRFGKKRKWLFLLLIPQLYTGIAGGSRTYLVLIASASLIYIYYWLQPKNLFWISIIPIMLISVFLITKSSMMTKIKISLSNLGTGNTHEFWRRLTNSRSVLWPQRLNAFRNLSPFNKLIGAGVNYTTSSFGMWSHSDFIEILCSFGIIGLLNYCYVIGYLFKKSLNKNASTLIKLFVVFIWFFNAFFNFFYCYFNSVLCYPILILSLRDLTMNNNKKIVYSAYPEKEFL